MDLLLYGLLLILALVLFMVLASRVYPRATAQSGAQAEQELTGVGPESAKGDPDDHFMG